MLLFVSLLLQKALARQDHPLQGRINGIVQRVAAKVPELSRLPEHRKTLQWRVYIVDSNMVNAMAAPGGHMIVFTGAVITVNLKSQEQRI